MTKRMVRVFLAGAIALGALGVVVPASARPGDVVTSGACHGRAEWRMRGRIAHGNVKVRYVVDADIPGLTWLVRISANNVLLFNGSRVTDSSGDFEVRIRKEDRLGTDAFDATATNTTTGETCAGNLTI